MKALSVVLLLLIAALQYPMWFGKGGLLQLREMNRELEAQRLTSLHLKTRNDALAAEVANLVNEGGKLEAVEERARNELGMVRKNEIYFQIQSK